MTVLLISSYDEFFTRAKHGAIWGRIYFQIGEDQFFPEKGWTDLVGVFLRCWLGDLLKIYEGSARTETTDFFDGPLKVRVSTVGAGLVELAFIHREILKSTATTRVTESLENAIAVADELLVRCQQNNWSNEDTEAITALTQEGRWALEDGDPP